jgi:hypothetical protein
MNLESAITSDTGDGPLIFFFESQGFSGMDINHLWVRQQMQPYSVINRMVCLVQSALDFASCNFLQFTFATFELLLNPDIRNYNKSNRSAYEKYK